MKKKLHNAGEDLGAAAEASRLKLEFRPLRIEGPEGEFDVEAIMKRAQVLADNVKTVIGFVPVALDWLMVKIPDLIAKGEERGLSAKMVISVLPEHQKPGIIKRRLDHLLRSDDLKEEWPEHWMEFRQTAWATLFEHLFKQCPEERERVEQLLAELCEEGYLLADQPENGGDQPVLWFRTFGRKYYIPPVSCLAGEKVASIQMVLDHLTGAAGAQEREQLIREVTPDFTFDDLIAGEVGSLLADIEPVPYTFIWRGEDGKEERTGWQPGGKLALESDGRKVWATGGNGNVRDRLTHAIEHRISIPVASLTDDEPYELSAPETRLSRPEFDEWLKGAKQTKMLWYCVVRGGIGLYHKHQAKLAEKVELGRRVSGPEEDLLLELKPGTYLIEWEGFWSDKDERGRWQPVTDMMFVLVRLTKDGKLSVKAAPAHLEEYFAPLMGEEFQVSDENFEGVEDPLGRLLRARRNRLLKNDQAAHAPEAESDAPEQEDQGATTLVECQ